MMDLKNKLPELISIAKDAGAKILEFYGKEDEALNITRKEDQTLLTNADLAAHKVVEAGLLKLTPDIPILSEEGKHLPFDQREKWDRYWLVDPLDGTRGFVERCGEFTVNIALIENHKSILGVLYAPVDDVCYYAVEDGKAYKIDKDGDPEVVHSREINWDDYQILLGNAKHTHPVIEKIKKLKGLSVRNLNSSYKFGYIAEGRADCYPRIGKTSEWDTAAAQVILEAAGGAVVDFEGEPLQYNTKSSLINPPFLAAGDKKAISQLLDMINKIRSEA